MALVQGMNFSGSTEVRYAAAEAIWFQSNCNIIDVLRGEAAASQMISINYELLVASPEHYLRQLCEHLQLNWEQQMLNPYDAESTKAFRESGTVLVGDMKLFKRKSIDATQANKWRHITLPGALRTATIALTSKLGYSELPLQLPPELKWLRPPQLHGSTPPSQLLLCIHPATGVFLALEQPLSLMPLPCLLLNLSSRSLYGCKSIAHLETRYWELVYSQVRLWRVEGGMRCTLGVSFGCRLAFSFASRFDEAGCCDIRVVLVDGVVQEQPFRTGSEDELVYRALTDSIRALHGDIAVRNSQLLMELPVEGDGVMMRIGELSGNVRALYVVSEDEPIGLKRVQAMVSSSNLEVMRLSGLHVEAIQSLASGAKSREFVDKVSQFLNHTAADSTTAS